LYHFKLGHGWSNIYSSGGFAKWAAAEDHPLTCAQPHLSTCENGGQLQNNQFQTNANSRCSRKQDDKRSDVFWCLETKLVQKSCAPAWVVQLRNWRRRLHGPIARLWPNSLEDTLRQHRLGDFDEPRNVRTINVAHRAVGALAILDTSVVNAFHDLLQALIDLFAWPVSSASHTLDQGFKS